MTDIGTLTHFMEWVENLPPGEYVFRGVKDETHTIKASTYLRLEKTKSESSESKDESSDESPDKLLMINIEMLEEARLQKHKRELPDLELLAELQHIGAATCLIDFTKNPFVALWMACRQSDDESANGKVYAINVTDGNKYERINVNNLKKHLQNFFQRDDIEGYQLYLWQPDYQKARMLAQQSVFLFGGGKILETDYYQVPNDKKVIIRGILKISLDMDEGSLFPDFQGFASQRAHNKLYDDPSKSDDPYETDPIAVYCLEQGRQDRKEGKFDNAINAYTTGISFDPVPALKKDLYRERGHAYYAKEDINAAISDYNEAIKVDINDHESYFSHGYALHKNADYDRAISAFDNAIYFNSSKALYYYWRAMSKYRKGLYKHSITDFNNAIRRDPSNPLYYHWLGIAYFNMEQYNHAINNFELAIGKDPSDAFFHYWRGLAHSRMEKYDKAVLDFNNAIQRKPDHPLFFFERALALKGLDVYEGIDSDVLAKQDFHTALKFAENIGDDELKNKIEKELLLLS